MSIHNKTGQTGEALAAEYFIKRGFKILHCNWRYRRLEVDIIACFKGTLHFIEVKTRTSRTFGYPEENVHTKKMRFLVDASAEFLYLHPQWERIQFDVLSVTLVTGLDPDFFLIEDVYPY